MAAAAAWAVRLLALFAAAFSFCGPALAAAEKPSYTRLVLNLEVGTDVNADVSYTIYQLEPGDRGSLLVRIEREAGDGPEVTTISARQCPTIEAVVEAFGRLPLPRVTLGELPPYDWRKPRPVRYQIRGFTRYPEGAAGEISYSFAEVPDRPIDRQLEWAQRFVLAVEGCARVSGGRPG